MRTVGIRTRLTALAVVSLVVAGLAVVTTAAPAAAGAFAVTTEADSGQGSYRQAILDASATEDDDVINFERGLTILLESDVDYDGGASGGVSALTLNGNGSTIQGADHQILNATYVSLVTVDGLTLTGGEAERGAAFKPLRGRGNPHGTGVDSGDATYHTQRETEPGTVRPR